LSLKKEEVGPVSERGDERDERIAELTQYSLKTTAAPTKPPSI